MIKTTHLTTVTTSLDHHPTCRLLELPAELRNHIYELVLTGNDTDTGDGVVDLFLAKPPTIDLLLVCREIFTEACQFHIAGCKRYWQITTFALQFALYTLPEREAALAGISDEALDCTRHLEYHTTKWDLARSFFSTVTWENFYHSTLDTELTPIVLIRTASWRWSIKNPMSVSSQPRDATTLWHLSFCSVIGPPQAPKECWVLMLDPDTSAPTYPRGPVVDAEVYAVSRQEIREIMGMGEGA
ncbi:hypothetical protein LTR86_007109 [Recurvomyces mirabilis]|nr:hypothetical protein LTR86_007109 [Recurvomyces mirabilis]